jgi:FkbM family methyltransferase
MIRCKYKTCHACYSEGYEAEDIQFLYDFLHKHENSIFLDVGAHVGLYVHRLNSLLNGHTNCKMIAVEPDNSVYGALTANIAPDTALAIAAWNEQATLFLSKEGKEIGRVTVDKINDNDIAVPAMPLDILNLFGNKISFDPHILAVKIDVEGAEHKVLIGMKQILAACKSGALVVELSNEHLGRYGADVLMTTKYLESLGFIPVKTDKQKIAEACHGYKRNVHFVKG